MSGGLLDGLTAIPAIMRDRGCSWDEASAQWQQDMRAELPPEEVLREGTIQRLAKDWGLSPNAVREQMDEADRIAKETFATGNVIPFRDRQ